MPKTKLHKLREGWTVQMRVIHALMIRELTTRFGRENIGFLWVMVEPLLFAGLVAIIWRLTKGPEEHGVGIVAFVVTGYIPITMFRHSVTRCITVFTVNASFLYHRQIKIVDFIFTRFLIEFLGSSMAYLFAGTLLIILGEFPIPENIGLFLAGWFLYSIFCLSVCLLLAPLSETSEVIEKFVPAALYVMIPFSGIFTMSSWLTPTMRDFLLWSPFVNAMEMMRKGIWGEEVTVYYNIWNPISCSMVAAVIGLALCRQVRRNLAVE